MAAGPRVPSMLKRLLGIALFVCSLAAVSAAAPAITSVNPSTFTAKQTYTITVLGTGFTPACDIIFMVNSSGIGIPTTYVSPTELRGTYEIPRYESDRSATIYVSDGDTFAKSNDFAVQIIGVPLPPSKLTFESQAVTGPVASGATAAWMRQGYLCNSCVTQMERVVLPDDDHDGDVRWSFAEVIPSNSLFAMVDLTTGELNVGNTSGKIPDPLPYPPAMFLRDPNGNFSHIVTTSGIHQLMWARPGVGAWGRVMDATSPAYNLDPTGPNGLVTNVSWLEPVGSSPPTPAGVEPGDVFVVFRNVTDPQWYGGRVDAQRGSGPGTIRGGGGSSGAESDGKAVVKVVRTGGTDGTVLIDYATQDDTAIAGEDYVATTGTLTFGDGEILKTIEVPLIYDDRYAGDRSFRVVFFNPSGGLTLTGDPFRVVRITDHPRPVLALGADLTVDEGDSGSPAASVDVTLTGASRVPVTVNWSAQLGGNYTNGTLTFEPYDTRKSFSVSWPANDVADYDRAISVSISTSASVDVTRASGTVTVRDDDGSAILRPPTNVTATATSPTTVVVTWVPSGAPAYEVSRSTRLSGGFWTTLSTSATSPFTDTTVTASSAYVYRVRALNGPQASTYGNLDFAITSFFSDDPLVPGVTPIRATHMAELQARLNKLLVLAVGGGVELSPVAGRIRTPDVNVLRVYLALGLSQFGITTPAFTDARLVPGTTTMKAAHINELRNALK
jgi:Calx-beta domain